MVRMLGGCMVFAGCLGLGLWYRYQFGARIKALHNLERMLELLASEVRYGRATLPECCSHIAGGLDSCGSPARRGSRTARCSCGR